MVRYRRIIRRTRADQLAERRLDGLDYRALQAKAKDLGIPANQPAEALRKAITEASK